VQYQYYWNNGIGNGQPGELFPYRLIDYINNSIPNDAVILERDQPLLYYYAAKDKSLRGQGVEKYILLRNDSLSGYNPVFEDQGFKLYNLKKEAGNLATANIGRKALLFETNFSSWNGKDEISIADIKKSIPPMAIQGFRGDFIFKRISDYEGNLIRVMISEPQFNERSEIQFGYCIPDDGLNLKVENKDILQIVTKMRINGSTSAELFVQDKTDYWSRENIYWQGNSWTDVAVSKRIRDNSTEICLGINWKPKSNKEWIDLKSVRIFVERNKSSF
jgi:hypothetical protein